MYMYAITFSKKCNVFVEIKDLLFSNGSHEYSELKTCLNLITGLACAGLWFSHFAYFKSTCCVLTG